MKNILRLVMDKNSLTTKIESLEAKICVIGLGQVGLPTALTFSKAGFYVIGHDNNEDLIKNLNQDKSPFHEEGLTELLIECKNNKKFFSNIKIVEAVGEADVIIICVQTPLTEEISPDLRALKNVCESLSLISLKNKLIIIESSIPPGTFSKIVLPTLISKSNKKEDFFTAFVPERLSPGQGLTEIKTTPRLIGAVDKESSELTKKLYKNIVTSEILISSIEITEISKLVENTFRDVNVAFANEVGMVCEKYGIDVKELIEVCNSHPRVNLLSPGPGVGGPCLPKDPYLLLNPQNGEKYDSKLINYSRKINDFMPTHVTKLVESELVKKNKQISKSNILIFGTSYKANVSDTRLAPSKEIISKLVEKGAKVTVFDPVSQESFGEKKIEQISQSNTNYDAIVILTDHDEFKKLSVSEIKKVLKDNSVMIDTRRIYSKVEVEELGINYSSVGYIKQT